MRARYLAAYEHAIAAIGHAGGRAGPIAEAPGISVKLSALASALRDGAARPRAWPSCCRASSSWPARRAQAGIGFTFDAEEADRLDLSLDLFEALALAPDLTAGTGSALPCRPIRSARCRSSTGSPISPGARAAG